MKFGFLGGTFVRIFFAFFFQGETQRVSWVWLVTAAVCFCVLTFGISSLRTAFIFFFLLTAVLQSLASCFVSCFASHLL